MRRDLLIFALSIIKDECDRHWNCIGCPFDYNNSCRFAGTTPTEWHIPDDGNEEIEPIEI